MKSKLTVMASKASGALTAATAVLSAAPGVFAEDLTAKNGVVNANHEATTTVDGSLPADGSITIEGANKAQSIKNKQFELFKIFDVENAEHEESVNYKFVDKYKQAVQNVVAAALTKRDNKEVKPEQVSEYMAIDYIQSLNNHQVEGAKTPQTNEGSYSAFRYFSEDLKNEIKKLEITGDVVTVESPNDQNEIKIQGLSWGYYFVDEISTGDDVSNGQAGTTEDGRSTDGIHFASSLVLVGTANKDLTIKLKSDYPTITKKINEDDNKTGWNDIGDYEIGQTVPYKYDSTIPNMNGYHGYYYAMEDKMDPELTFNADKEAIKMTITDGQKSYQLKSDEFKLAARGENVTKEQNDTLGGFDKDLTFKIEIPDLKAIVDREFAKPMGDDNQENDYSGLTMKTEYTATLNEKAADKTGRPGFENDVRLVFSNDPDSTGTGKNEPNRPPHEQPKGKTPWDTVVAFTFRMNGLKVNSNNFALQDAHFRLYSDPEGKNEVFVKQKTNATPIDETKTNTDTPTHVTAPNEAKTEANAETGPQVDTTEKKGTSNETGTVGATENLKSEKHSSTKDENGANEYVVINRDQLGGTDHTGGKAPANATVIKSDADGNFSIVGLDQGAYYLKEVKAPKGYRLLQDPIKITVTPTYTSDRDAYIKGEGATPKTLAALQANGEIKEFYHEIFKQGQKDFNTNVENGSFDVKVVNEVLSKLPVTGEQGAIAAIALSGTLVAIGTVLYVKHKKEQNEFDTTA